MTSQLDPAVSKMIPEELTSNFEKCAADPNIPLYEIIQGFEHLVLLLNRLGTMFTFITSDILEKVKLLREKRLEEFQAISLSSENSNSNSVPIDSSSLKNYKNFATMLAFEKNSIDKKKRPSRSHPPTGTRQVQLLQRAMKMLYIFMNKIAKNDCNGKVSQMAWEAYSDSPLPNHHPWLVRNAVKVAVYTLPTRENFFKQACPELTTDEIIVHFHRAIASMDTIYNRLEEFYSQNDLLNMA